MRTKLILAAAVLMIAGGFALHVTRAQQSEIKRTDLQRHDLSVPGREVIQVRVDIPAGAAFPRAQPSGRGDGLYDRRLAGVSTRR